MKKIILISLLPIFLSACFGTQETPEVVEPKESEIIKETIEITEKPETFPPALEEPEQQKTEEAVVVEETIIETPVLIEEKVEKPSESEEQEEVSETVFTESDLEEIDKVDGELEGIIDELFNDLDL